MEKKFKFSDKATVSKIVYAAVIAILCISAIVIGIVAANNRRGQTTEEPDKTPDDGTQGDETPKPDDGTDSTPSPEVKLTFVSPAVGTVIKSHSATVPVFSETLDEWRIHSGLDIMTEEGAMVVAAEAGTVSAVYDDPMFGRTVEITHSETVKTRYSNLDGQTVSLKVGDSVKEGDAVGCIGDSAIIEIADEAHLHFELLVENVSVNPLDYIDPDSLEASLGIVGE